MGQVVGFYFAGIYPVLTLICCILIYLKKDHHFIRCRNPTLLIIQNIGSVISFEFITLYLALRPDFSCGLFFVGVDILFSCFAVPLLLRCWEYCVNFHISLLKLHYRSSLFLNWQKTSWFFEHKWVASPSFLRKLMVVLMVLISIPCIVAAFPDQFRYSEVSQGCTVNNIFYFGIAVAIIFIGFAIYMGFLIFRARDVYHIKDELMILATVWMAAVVVFCAYSTSSRPEQRTFPSPWVLVIGYVITLGVCNGLPLFFAYMFDRRMKKSEGSLATFLSLLESVHFRNGFHEFLTKQFCQENLQFYEVVMEWKNLRIGDPDRTDKARAIVNVFILETGVCQVNIASRVRDRIVQESTKIDVAMTIFDEALDSLIRDMHLNSYHMYRSSNLRVVFNSSKSVEDGANSPRRPTPGLATVESMT